MDIFLDTNVFESAKFNYTSNNMTSFLKFCEENEIKLKITDVVEYEVKKRINTNIADTFEKIDKNNLAVVAASLGIDPSTSKIQIIEHLSNNLKDKFQDLLADYSIEVIESNYNINELTMVYFKKQDPFSEQKKHEFPDALILLTIKKYISDHPYRTIYIVSNDKGCIKFCENHNIGHFNMISQALNFLIQNPNLPLQNAFNRQVDKIKERIINDIKNIDDFVLYSYDSIDYIDVDEISINNVNVNDINIIHLNSFESSLSIEGSLSIEFSCKAYYSDPDTLTYDKEDSAYYSYSKCISDINFTENVKCNVAIYFDENFDFDIYDIDLYNKEFEFFLDSRYIIKTEYEEY